MSAIIIVIIVLVLLILMALGCYLDLCGGNFAGAADGGGKGGVSPKGLFTAGVVLAGLDAAGRRQSSGDLRQSGEYWSNTGEGSPALFEGIMGGTTSSDAASGWGHAGDVSSSSCNVGGGGFDEV